MKKIVLATLLALPSALSAADYAWLEYGPAGPIARAIVKGDGPCPSIVLNGSPQRMTVRAPASKDYEVTSCEASVPVGTTSAIVDGVSLPVAKLGKSTKIALVGDTGCRRKLSSKGTPQIQNCADPVQWPYAAVADAIAAWDPDLVIQVGDYYYREAKKDAKGNWVKAGYDWHRWHEDFFKPGKKLLPNAPWIFIRGNHEECGRAASGWFRFLDPWPYTWEGAKFCSSNLEYTRPWTVTVGNQSFAIIDSSGVDESTVSPTDVSTFQSQLELLAKLTPPNSWLLLHHPFWVVSPYGTGTAPMWTAWQQASALPAVSLVVAGHEHLLEGLDFTDGKVPQMIVGNGGTALDNPPSSGGKGTAIGNRTVANYFLFDDYGFIAATPAANGWSFAINSTNGTTKATCAVTASSLVCK